MPEKRGLTFYEVLTLASIVEREAVLDDERPLIAGVYQNRLDRVPSVRHGLLQADPTVIYAVDTDKLGKYRPGLGGVRVLDRPRGRRRCATSRCPRSSPGYNTYMVRGPAARPDRDARPSPRSTRPSSPTRKSGYTYFVAIPDGDGAHDFSKSLEPSTRRKLASTATARHADGRAAGPCGLRAAARRGDPRPLARGRAVAPPGACSRGSASDLAAAGVDAYFGARPGAHALAHRVHARRGRGQGRGPLGPVPRRVRTTSSWSPTRATRSRPAARRRTRWSTRSATTSPRTGRG